MIQAHSFVNELQQKYPAPQGNKPQFDEKDIQVFEKELGAELPSDFYEFLRVYGHGSFSDYFYIWNPFAENGRETFIIQNNQAKKNYEYLEEQWNKWDIAMRVDCRFSDDGIVVLNGDIKQVEFLRTECIDGHTRSKILALGNHFPYAFFPEKNGLINFGRTDDDDFFMRIQDKKISIVMYSDDYYEFDMSVTEFMYEYLTKTIKLPMMNDETEWTFISCD